MDIEFSPFFILTNDPKLEKGDSLQKLGDRNAPETCTCVHLWQPKVPTPDYVGGQFTIEGVLPFPYITCSVHNDKEYRQSTLDELESTTPQLQHELP